MELWVTYEVEHHPGRDEHGIVQLGSHSAKQCAYRTKEGIKSAMKDSTLLHEDANCLIFFEFWDRPWHKHPRTLVIFQRTEVSVKKNVMAKIEEMAKEKKMELAG